MGSIVMEPGDIAAFKNLSSICLHTNRIHGTTIFIGANPLEFSIPLLLFQLGICAATIGLVSRLLKPFGQPLIVSQVLGGLVLGSSGLGYFENLREAVFPIRGLVFLDVVSGLGLIFYLFLVGLQTDISILKNIDKRAFGIGICSVVFPSILTTIYGISLLNFVDTEYVKTLFTIGKGETVINFAMVAALLSELKLINSNFGRIALSSSMISNFISFSYVKLGFMLDAESEVGYRILMELYAILVIAVIIFAIRLVALWMIKKNPVGQPLKESFVITLLLGMLVVAFCSRASGMNIYSGPFLLGIALPSGSPVGSTLVEKLDLITNWVFMPVFFLKIGLIVNIYTIKLLNVLCVSLIVIVGAIGKFAGGFMVSMYYKLPIRDAVSLGLILNSQGALELGMFKVGMNDKIIDNDAFAVLCIDIMVLVAVITPAIRYLSNPSARYLDYKKRSIMNSRSEIDLCVLVCIHDQEDVPSAINLLEALYPTRRSHLVVYILHLVDLLGRANPQLIYHKLTKRTSGSCPSSHIVNAFKYFGQSNREIVAIHPFTAISPLATMHDDVCSLALEKKSSLILVPFHKRFHSNGVVSLSKSKTKMVNHHILDLAPCSVALIVERGVSKVQGSIATNLHPFQIVVIFIGGPDDHEAIFIGARMASHPNINLTVIRILENENIPSHDATEKMLDNEIVDEFRLTTTDNSNVRFIEEVAEDGAGTVGILRSMGNNFDLVIVGRQHSPRSPLVQGMLLWNETTELGAIGEVLASSDFLGNATILVVQQHTKVGNEGKNNHFETNINSNRV